MSQPRFQLLLLSFLAFCLALTDHACAQEPAVRSSKPDQNIVVLRNGGVLRGRTVEDGNTCIVYLRGKSEIRLPQDAIDFICKSMQQAYEIQRDRNSADDLDAHIELVDWCVRQDMLEQAAAELDLIQDAAQSDVRVRSLQHQIASRRRLQQTQSVARPLVEPPRAVQPQENFSDTRLPQISSQSIGLFKTSVQSRLLNGCAASGCHGVNSDSSFQLACESPSRPATRRMTFENFAACFQLIDRTTPEKSELLKYAATPHAGLNAPVYRQGSKHFEAIANWVTIASLSQNDATAADRPQPTSGQVRLVTALQELQNDLPNGETRLTKFPATSFQNPHAADQNSGGVDPFDPEVFNRLYGTPPSAQTDDQNTALDNDSVGGKDTTLLQAPQRLSDSQKQGAIQISESKD